MPQQRGESDVKVVLPISSPRDAIADAAAAAEAAAKAARKEEEERLFDQQRPLNESVFAVSAAQFVTDNCPYLRVDFQQLTDVLQARGIEYETAKESEGYAENIRRWTEEIRKNGASETCYMFQARFFGLSAKDMNRMIARRE